jgi:hypothetical protein
MPFDPTKPADGTEADAAEMRGQLTALFDEAQVRAREDDCLGRALGSARDPAAVEPLNLSHGDSTVVAIIDKVNELIAALKR